MAAQLKEGTWKVLQREVHRQDANLRKYKANSAEIESRTREKGCD